MKFIFYLFVLCAGVLTPLSAQQYNVIQTLEGHRSAVTYVTLRQQDNLLASGSKDGNIILWNIESAQKIKSFSGHTDLITHISFSKDGHKMISASYDGTIKLWNFNNGQLVKSFDNPGIGAYAGFKGNEPTFAQFTEDETELIFGGYNAKVFKTHIQTGRQELLYQDYVGGITCGQVAGNQLIIGTTNKIISLNISTGQINKTITNGTTATENFICEIAYFKQSQNLLSWVQGGEVKQWNNSELTASFRATERQGSSFIAVSNDETLILTGNKENTVYLWNLDNKQLLQSLEAHTSVVNTYCFSGDKQYIITGGDDKFIKVWTFSDTATITITENEDREVVVKETINVTANEFKIELWDHQMYDGDTISLYYGNKLLVERYEVKPEKKIITVEIASNAEKQLILHAHNEGKIPPNTVAISIDDGVNKQVVHLRSSLITSQAIVIRHSQ